MTDRPPDHEHVVADRPPTDQRDQPVPLEEAAAALGITVNAVRQRIKRGTLLGVRTAAGWSVVVERPTDHPRDRPPTDHAPSVDLAPLAGLIERQGAEVRRLTEAATVWQLRALQAEERLQQLTAGDVPTDPPVAAQDGPGAAAEAGAGSAASSPPPAPPAPPRRPAWWRRLLWGDR